MDGGINLGIEGLSGLREIGAGGFATVYVGFDEAFSRPVAVKVLHGLDDGGRRRFVRECELMGRLDDHPNVITPYRTGYTTTGAAYLVMEYAANGSLESLLDGGRRLVWFDAVGHLIPILGALGHAHSLGIEHRDVKPANILLTAAGITKLTDFGIASIREATATATVAFTLAHCPPETFADGYDRRDERSDLYSVASTLYTLVAGRPPFQLDGHDSETAYMHRILTATPPPLGLGPDVDHLMSAALSKSPDERPATAADFTTALGAAVATPGAVPPPASGVAAEPARPPLAVPGPMGAAPAPAGYQGQSADRSAGGWWLALGIGAGVVAVIIAVTMFQLIQGDPDEAATTPIEQAGADGGTADEDSSEAAGPAASSAAGGDADQQAGSSPTPATPTIADTTTTANQATDQVVANAVALQSSDLGSGWTVEKPALSHDESIAYYEAAPTCTDLLPAIRADSAWVTEGEDILFTNGQANVTFSLAFFPSSELADPSGPDGLLDPRFEECRRPALSAALVDVNGAGSQPVIEVVELPPPDFGDKAALIQLAIHFTSPQATLYQNVWVFQIERAVLSMYWTSESEPGADARNIVELIARRFEDELAALG